MVYIHITAGLLALIAGFAALFARKGSVVHRYSGLAFVVAMLTMTSTAVFIAAFLRPNTVNIVAGTTTFYLVLSGFLTMRYPLERMRALFIGLTFAALAASAGAFTVANAISNLPGGRLIDGVTAEPLYMFGVVALFAAVGDVRMLIAGGIQGVKRLARHLWRMTFGLWIATASFFLGQASVMPGFLRDNMGLRAVPVLLVLGFLFYWMVRVRIRRRAAGVQPQLVGSR